MKTLEAQKFNLVVLLRACTKNPKVHHLPEHTTAVLSNMFQIVQSKFLRHKKFQVELTDF